MVHEKQFHATVFSSDSDYDRSGLTSNNTATSANNARWKLGLTASLAAATVCLPNHNRTVNATELNHSVAQDSSSKINASSSTRSSERLSGLLPRVFNKIGFSVKSKLASLPKTSSAPKNQLSKTSFAPERSQFNREQNVADSLHFKTMSRSKRQFASLSHAEQTIALAVESSSTQARHEVYRVKPGDTINRIAKKHQVSKADLIALNKIHNSNIIFVNQELKIPAKVATTSSHTTSISPANKLASSKLTSNTDIAATPGSRHNSVKPTAPTEDPHIDRLKEEINLLREQYRQNSSSVNLPSASKSPKKTVSASDLDSSSQNNFDSKLLEDRAIALVLPPLPPSSEYLPSAFDGYIWPAQGVLTSGYGWRWGRLHRGIDIAAPVGTPVLAAASGKVVNAGWHSGYGNLIKLEHLDGSVTVYAHNHQNLVTHGQRVQQGQQIAEMGSTGNSTGSHLHFEIHSKDKAVLDPLALLDGK